MQPPDEPESAARPELSSLCANMDAKGIRSFIMGNCATELPAIRAELAAALRSAPDPATLVLDALDGVYPPKGVVRESDTNELRLRRLCMNLLEKLHAVAPEIKVSVRERAKKIGREWKGKIPVGERIGRSDRGIEVLSFLQFVVTYGLSAEFKADELLEILVSVSRRKQTVETIKSLGLEDSVPDFIQKLSNKGKQIDAVKFVYAFNLLDKYPPAALLKDYVKESRKAAEEVRKRKYSGNQSEHDAAMKEISALKAVAKAVEDYKLEAEYPCENLRKRIAQLEKQKADKKRPAFSAPTSDVKTKQQQRQGKRLRPSLTTPTAEVPRPLQSFDQSTFLDLSRSYGLHTSSSLYDRPVPAISGISDPLGGNLALHYSSEPLVSSGLYDRLPGRYSMSGLPSSSYFAGLQERSDAGYSLPAHLSYGSGLHEKPSGGYSLHYP